MCIKSNVYSWFVKHEKTCWRNKVLLSFGNVIGMNGKEVKEFIKKEKYLIIIDIRTAMEVRVGKISEDNHIDFYDLSFQDKIDKEKNWFIVI